MVSLHREKGESFKKRDVMWKKPLDSLHQEPGRM